eukprot:m.255486 g.255486  ORF g.255486 m.255486 type:complete len:398 (-) comp19616_c0_seq4:151-1344(-)
MTVSTTPGTPCTFSGVNEDVMNTLAIGTMVFGILSMILCTCVVSVIVAYSKEKMYLRERIIFGLMLSNMAFSVTNIIPVQLIEHDCTNTITIIPKAWTRGVWFWGKYWMVCYEIFIAGTTIMALHSGRSKLPWKVETFCHCLSLFTGIAAFVVWVSLAVPFAEKEKRLMAQSAECVENTTDFDEYRDCLMDQGTWEEFASFRPYYYPWVMATMIRAWLAPFGVSLLLWLLSRFLYHKLLSDWNQDHKDAIHLWDADLDGVRVKRQMRLLDLRREAYNEIARPLEPYIAVFIVFAIPAIVMATDYCQNVSTEKNRYCQVPCETVLALRSGTTAAAYFWNYEHRCQLFNVGDLWKRLRIRLCYRLGRSPTRGQRGSRYTHHPGGHVSFAENLDVRLLEK